jgi:hypothetical protein
VTSYSAYVWLRERSFDIVHFHALGGIGYYTLLAKQEQLLPRIHNIVVGVHAIAGTEMDNVDRGRDPDAPVLDFGNQLQDYIQQRSVELSVSFLFESVEMSQEISFADSCPQL